MAAVELAAGHRRKRRATVALTLAISFAAVAVAGCATTTAAAVLGSALNLALDAGRRGDRPRDQEPSPSYEVPMRIVAGERLNTAEDGTPLALVVRVYLLRSHQAFERLSQAEAQSPASEKAALGGDLVSVRELILIPGRTYSLPQTLPGTVSAIGVVALFRNPAEGRWKLAIDARASQPSGITVGAHACALTLGKGTLTNSHASESARILSGTRCAT